jgi:DTW domain-containing protein YfiP
MYPPKPFVARGSRVLRCRSCLLAAHVCICDFKMSYQSEAQFFLLMHHNEGFKPTNTGRLIEDCIADTKRFEWSRTEPSDELLRAITDPQLDPYIVFPEGEGYEGRMVKYEPKKGKRPVFIVLDGTWRQARRMFRLSRYLDHLPVIEPEVVASSNYHLRKAAVDGQLCTAEVAALMLQQINDTKGAEILSAYFSIFNDHYKASRLNRPLDDHSEAKDFLRRLKAD